MPRRIPALVIAALFMTPTPARAFDHGFPKDTERSRFFEQLKRPDYYPHSCCGEADAYEADIYQRNADGSYDVEITDGSEKTYPDGTFRIGLKNGTKVRVPSDQINPTTETQFNPTGHAWLFVSARRGYGSDANPDAEPGMTYCFAPLPEGS
jgi:hypothetical protein